MFQVVQWSGLDLIYAVSASPGFEVGLVRAARGLATFYSEGKSASNITIKRYKEDIFKRYENV